MARPRVRQRRGGTIGQANDPMATNVQSSFERERLEGVSSNYQHIHVESPYVGPLRIGWYRTGRTMASWAGMTLPPLSGQPERPTS